MYPVTQDYLSEIKATERRVYAKCQIDYTDPFLDQSISVAASEQANISIPAQTADTVTEPVGKIAALDGAWVLDGTWCLAPGPDEAKTKQMGWWGSQLSGADGSFTAPYPTLTVTFFSRPITQLKVVGDSKRGEYPVDFVIKLYGSGDVLKYTETVTGNTQVNWSKILTNPVTEVVKMTLEISKWSHPSRQVKILEFFTSIQETYEGDDVLLINLLEEREVSQGSLPVGNISANEIDVRLNNVTRKFDAGNTASPLYQLLKQNRRIKAWLGMDAENNYSSNPPTFTRSSVAYKSDGTQVADNVPRFEQGKFGKAVMVEEGTTNKIETEGGGASQDWTKWSHWNSTNYWYTCEQYDDPVMGKVFKGTAKNNTFLFDYYPYTVTAGVTYTLNVWLKANVEVTRTLIGYMTRSTDNAAIGNQSKTVTIKTTWQKFEWQITPNESRTVSAGIGIRFESGWDGVIIEAARPQLEQKPYSTSFINGTRSAETLTIPTAGVLNPQEGTVECWWMPINQPASTMTGSQLVAPPIIQVGNYYQNNSWILWCGINSQLRLYARGDNATGWTGNWTIIPNLNWYQLNQWYHIVVIWQNANTFWVFIDGIKYGPYVSSLPLVSIAGNIMSLGRFDAASGPSNAIFDDLRISNRARTDAEILAAYQSGQPLQRDDSTTYLLSFNGSIYPVERVWVPLGTFWSGDWSAPEDGVYAQITGRDRLELLRKSTYSTSTVQTNKTLYDLAIAVLQNAGLTSSEYFVDTELQQYTIPYAYFEPQSHREALRKIAEACLGQVYADRNGVIRVEGPSYLTSKTMADITITQNDYFRKDNPVKWGQIANYIEIETQPLRPDVSQEVYRSNDPVSIAASQTLTLTVYYNQTPCISAVASLVGATNTIITTATYYAWGANITIKNNGTTAESVTIVINAQPLKVLNKEKAIAQDSASITDNGMLKYTFPANPLVQTLSMAQTIANKLLASVKDPRRDVEVEWRGNPALLLGDRVKVTDKLEQNDYYVVRQEIEFSGALRAKLSGRRA